jgi:hypothetical protein
MTVRESLPVIIVDLTDKKPRLRGHPLRGFDLRRRTRDWAPWGEVGGV